ncbi:flagellin N-terminal helical domain-containing protein, partial [Thiomicrorhabdus heinhorstiae]
ALNANRILNQTSNEQSTTMERLTSGKQINSAADNAAGLAIATGMSSQIAGTDQAIRNANDGISLLQTVDGATEEVVNMMQRMRELATQSLNGTYSAENRAQMDEEFTQLQNEVDRVAKTTKFNDSALMNGSTATVDLHVGWQTGADNKITVSMKNFSAGQLQTSAAIAVDTQANASAAIAAIDQDLSNINLQRAKWGALQNRLESTVSNLSNVNENISAA